ncbi:MAG: heterodisulfide reductase-related iron-sulfur binding cluster [Proteobacteria bacterium]|nr:heterodisulfide reductase-related iron-sulfur binding cluster [Pseudomonadota bacterium]
MLNSLDMLFISLTVLVFVFGLILKATRWKRGQETSRLDNLYENFLSSAERVFSHRDLLREKKMGFFHVFLFYLFVIALILVIVFHIPFSLPAILAGVQSIILDSIALIALVGIVYFYYRRLTEKDRGFDNKKEDFVLLIWLFLIFITGFLMEAVRLKVFKEKGVFAPAGLMFSVLIPSNQEYYPLLSQLFWRAHLFLVLSFIAFIPYTKAIHIVLIPLSYLFKNPIPKGAYKLYDLDNSEEFGANKISDLNWKDLMDLDTCVRCGRCQENCPAFLTEKPLSPKKVIQDLKTVLYKSDKDLQSPLINEDITEEVIFSCTTCRACMENCPAGIEHLDKMMEIKRYLVLMEGSISPEAQLLFKNLERNGNPWGMPASTRAEWAKELDVKFLAEIDDPKSIDFLFWPGCAGAFDDRYSKVVKKIVEIFNRADLKFALLGEEETCCGDPARKLGNEYLYDMLARQNIETMNNYGIKKIVTSCPHCLNTLKRDYSQIGGNYEVVSHSEFLLSLLKEGKINLNKSLEGKFVYHDSCYLARYNDVYDEPREVIKKSGLKLTEFERRGIKGFCCGGGGGNMFLEEHSPRMNDTRVKQILDSGEGKDLTGIATACPFCLTMMTDGTKTYNREDIVVKDIAEIIYEAL